MKVIATLALGISLIGHAAFASSCIEYGAPPANECIQWQNSGPCLEFGVDGQCLRGKISGPCIEFDVQDQCLQWQNM